MNSQADNLCDESVLQRPTCVSSALRSLVALILVEAGGFEIRSLPHSPLVSIRLTLAG